MPTGYDEMPAEAPAKRGPDEMFSDEEELKIQKLTRLYNLFGDSGPFHLAMRTLLPESDDASRLVNAADHNEPSRLDFYALPVAAILASAGLFVAAMKKPEYMGELWPVVTMLWGLWIRRGRST